MTGKTWSLAALVTILGLTSQPAWSIVNVETEEGRAGGASGSNTFECNGGRYVRSTCGVYRCLNDLWGNFEADLRTDASRAKQALAVTASAADREAQQARDAVFGAINAIRQARAEFGLAAQSASEELSEPEAQVDAAALDAAYAANSKAARCLEPHERRGVQLAESIGEPEEDRTLKHYTSKAAEHGFRNYPNLWDTRYRLWSNSIGAIAAERTVVSALAGAALQSEGIVSSSCLPDGQDATGARRKLEALAAEVNRAYEEALGYLEAPWCKRDAHRCAPTVSPQLVETWQAYFDKLEAVNQFRTVQIPMEAHEAQGKYSEALGSSGDPEGSDGRSFAESTKSLLDASFSAARAKGKWADKVRQHCR